MATLLGSIEGVEIVGEAEETGVALAGIEASAADLVVLEWHLTGSTGMDLLARLAERTTPVIAMVLSNHSGTCFRQACLSSGAHYFFDKTSEFELARNTIERIANERCARGFADTGAHHV
ncbi:Response regulator receiver domain-containing protein [Paraburkholderia phenazinium]|uniref:Response regulator receiver domain-containing protein n=2 Tax=Paraburkholderia phenazinium TaxID=60549 RepID=A0A1G7RGX6_9BURK|nr:Response regulator receiver domain-containing protein [Paraburkholderia phenazinium]